MPIIRKSKKEEIVETVIDMETEIVHENAPSDAKVAYFKMMEAYKKQNPVKYAMKEEIFLKKLSTL